MSGPTIPQQPSRKPLINRVEFSREATRDSNPEETSEPSQSRFISQSGRKFTDIDEIPIDSRAFKHAQIIKRPRALQYASSENSSEKGSNTPTRLISNTSSQRDAKDAEERSDGGIPKQLNRLDLFVDLIWVGIIANLSATFSEQAFSPDSGVDIGLSIIEFILLFLPIWRVWDSLRSYTSHYYLDDFVQRLFMV